MRTPKGLHKTTIVVWSDYDPATHELADLVRDACEGDAYCSKQHSVFVEKFEDDPDWDGTEFFGIPDDPEEE